MQVLQFVTPIIDLAGTSPDSQPGRCPLVDMTDQERDARSTAEWLDAISGYLEFRAGDSWRRIHRSDQRYNPVRWYYLDALRLINMLRAGGEIARPSTAVTRKQTIRHLPAMATIESMFAGRRA